MSEKVSATELMNQAVPTVMTYYMQVVDELDQEMGKGYAKANPELVGRLVDAASRDMVGMSLANAITEFKEDLSTRLQTLKVVSSH